MFGFAKLKIDNESQAALDVRIDWIVMTFGLSYLKEKAIVLDSDLFTTQDQKLAEDEFLAAVSRRVMKRMDVDESKAAFFLSVNDQSQRVMKGFVQSNTPGSPSAGRYYEDRGKVFIEIEESHLESPILFVATLVHELCHYKLLFEGRIDENDEVLTDILPTFFGFGLFSSAAVMMFSQYNEAGMQGWSIRSAGYLSEYEHGYILARWVRITGQDRKVVERLLKPNVQDSFAKTVKWMEKASGTAHAESTFL